jgi:RimJ/RimL family protein N-acetyltransferase
LYGICGPSFSLTPISSGSAASLDKLMDVILETESLLLREMMQEDFTALFEIFSDGETMSFYPEPFDKDKVIGWIEWNIASYAKYGYGLWAVLCKESGVVVGDCGLITQVVDGAEEVEISYHINKAFWGRGYATEAAIACRNYAFNSLGLPRVISLIRPENLPSCRVAEKNGMTVTSQIVKSGYHHYVYSCESISSRGSPDP